MVSVGIILVCNFYPPILRAINVNVAFVLSLAIALVFMVIPLPSSITMLCYKLQINRIIGFYPFFLLGIILKKTGNLPYVERNSKLILVVAVTIYLLLCYANEGLAYQGSFYLQPQSGFRKIVLQMMSYLIIMPLCVTLVCSMPRKEVWFSRFGSRTLNVYLLHMLVVFPVCYGIFSHLGYSVELIVLNCMLAFSICLLFFSATVDRKMKYLLKTNCWAFVLSLYVVSLVVVNSHYLFKLF